MKILSDYKGRIIVRYGTKHFHYGITDDRKCRKKPHSMYASLQELYDDIDRRERRIQLIMADPRL
jgi:hypothetical protein